MFSITSKNRSTEGCSKLKSSGEIGLNIKTLASPKVGQDRVSGGVSVPCQHATPVADAPWKPIFSNVKFSKKSNQGKGYELVVSNQGMESNSVRSQLTQGKGGIAYDSKIESLKIVNNFRAGGSGELEVRFPSCV